MTKGLVQPRSGGVVANRPHNEFLELCAVSTSGQLTEAEQKRLEEHLVVCQSCRKTIQQYETVASRAIPVIAASEASEDLEPGPDWSEEQAEKALFGRLAQEEKRNSDQFENTNGIFTAPHRLPPFSSESTWRHVWMLYAAGILVFASLSLYAYWAGAHRGADITKLAPTRPSPLNQLSLEAQLSDTGYERQIARAHIEQRDKTIVRLRQQLAEQSGEINRMKAAQDRLKTDLRARDASGQDLVQRRAELEQKLDAAQSSSLELQQKLESLAQQSAQDAARAKTLDAKVKDLNRLLYDRDVALDQEGELFARDRDIRDLMGARDLYIAEVYDVARTGETQKPYGRVFYTRGKSLVFYAYGLDQQTAAKRTSTFQAWGRRGGGSATGAQPRRFLRGQRLQETMDLEVRRP